MLETNENNDSCSEKESYIEKETSEEDGKYKFDKKERYLQTQILAKKLGVDKTGGGKNQKYAPTSLDKSGKPIVYQQIGYDKGGKPFCLQNMDGKEQASLEKAAQQYIKHKIEKGEFYFDKNGNLCDKNEKIIIPNSKLISKKFMQPPFFPFSMFNGPFFPPQNFQFKKIQQRVGPVPQPITTEQQQTRLTPIPNGACSMMKPEEINKETRKQKPRLSHSDQVSVQPINLIAPVNGNDDDICYKHTSALILGCQKDISNLYNTYIAGNTHDKDLNEAFLEFSSNMMTSMFEMIKTYNEYRSYIEDPENDTATNYGRNYIKELGEANREARKVFAEQLRQGKKNFVEAANDLFDNKAEKLLTARGNTLDDIAVDDCVFSLKKLDDTLFPVNSSNNTGCDYSPYDYARDAFLEELKIDEEDKEKNMVCNIDQFTGALLTAAAATFTEDDYPSQKQYECVKKCITHAFTVANAGWKRVSSLFKNVSREKRDQVEEQVRAKYDEIFNNISKCKSDYEKHLKEKLEETNIPKDKHMINGFIKNSEKNIKTQRPQERTRTKERPQQMAPVNNNFSQMGLNTPGYQTPAYYFD